MAKYGNKISKDFRSNLERTANELLLQSKLEFEYEPFEIVLIPSFTSEIDSMELIGKGKNRKYKLQSKKLKSTKYTPDFVGNNWVIETKGMRTADFNIKWKMFKILLAEYGIKPYLFMPTNKKQIISSIELIKEIEQSDNIFTPLKTINHGITINTHL